MLLIINIIFIILSLLVFRKREKVRLVTLLGSLSLLIISVYYNLTYIYNIYYFEGLIFSNKIYLGNLFFENFFFSFNINLDSFSLLLIFLTIILYIVSIISIWDIKEYYRFLHTLLLLVILLVILSFLVFDLLFFYVFFEFLLIPMFIIIGFWGSRERKLTAAFRFFFFYVNRFNFFFNCDYMYLYGIWNNKFISFVYIKYIFG